jgi:E3 ubiquitin-protein ligase MYCBP2
MTRLIYICQVEVRAVPIDLDPSGDEYKRMRRLSRPDEGTTTFGGHPPPCLETPYEVTVKDKKDAFHAICMMKVSVTDLSYLTLYSTIDVSG